MNWFDVIIIAIVEGLTEFLPVSSTGHMIITERLLNVEMTDFVKAFTVIIQLGAILSVVVLYWKRFFQSFGFYWKLCVGVIPAVVMGLFLSGFIKSIMDQVWVVALMLLLGGIVMLFVDKWFAGNTEVEEAAHQGKPEGEEITYKRSFFIGMFQCIAMIPGVSRSMASIVGGMQQGLTRKQAAEFSFFLAVPTMFGATAKELYDLMKDPAQLSQLMDGIPYLLVGSLVAFVVALLAIKFFIGYVSKYGFRSFGYYRIVLGVIILVLLACNIGLKFV